MHATIAVTGILFIAGTLLLNYFISQQKKLHNTFYPNVYIDSIHAGYKTKEEMTYLLNKKYQKIQSVNMIIEYKDTPVATFEAAFLEIQPTINDDIERAYLVGRSSNAPSRIYQKIATMFNIARYDFTTIVTYARDPLQQFVDAIEDQYNKPAKNALFTFENGRVTSFRTEEQGMKILTDSFIEETNDKIMKLKQEPENIHITLKDKVIEPEVTLAEANDFNIEEQIGEGKSDYSHSIPERIHNVQLAASKFHGVLIEKDKVFSFTDTIGDISSLTGYKPAYIIKAGKTVLGDGGGVCQVSTTLFRAALNTGLPIIERHAHAYRVGYYENDSKPGLDATIFSPTVDLKIHNNTDGAILILTEIDSENNLLTFRFYGKKDGRKVELTEPIMGTVSAPPPPVYQDDASLKKGVTKQIEYAAWGGRSTFAYKVTRGTETMIDQTFVSNYRPWQAVYLVGQAD